MDEEKKKYYTPAQSKATQKYIKNNLDRIEIKVPKGYKEKYKIAAKAAGLSMNKFFVTAANEKIEREGLLDEELLEDEDIDDLG